MTKHHEPNRIHVRGILAAVALAVLSLTANAANLGKQGFSARASGSNHFTTNPYEGAMSGQPLLNQAIPSGFNSRPGMPIGSKAVGQDIIVGQRGGLPIPGTKNPTIIDVTARVVKNPATAQAMRRAMSRVPGPLGAAVTLYNFFDMLELEPVREGSIVAFYGNRQRLDGFYFLTPHSTGNNEFESTEEACAAKYPTSPDRYVTPAPNKGPNRYFCHDGFGNAWDIDFSGNVVTERRKLTDQEFEQEFMSRNWPSNAPEAILDTIASGETVPVDQVQVQGPASVAGPTTTRQETTTDANGTPVVRNITTSSTTNITYNDARITYNNTTISTTTNQQGEVISETVETGVEPEPEETECEKNPESVGCAEADVPDGEIPKDTKEVSYAFTELFGGGSCPADVTMHFQGINRTLKVWDWQQACGYISGPIKAMVLLLAGWVAFIILLPDGGIKAST